MKIKVDDIPESGLEINADSNHAAWLNTIFQESFGKTAMIEDDSGRLNLQLFRSDRQVTAIGGLILKFHPACDRCLAVFAKQQQIPIHQILVPAFFKDGKRAESSTDDEDVSFYEGDEIDIANIVKEQVILAQQMVSRCGEDCKGLCPRCGKNLNNGPCRCKKAEEHDSPFAILKKQRKKKRA
jgi:uncharacterized protein